MKKDTSIKTESQDVPIPFPADLKGILQELADYYGEDFERFVIWALREQVKGMLDNSSEMGTMIADYLRKKHCFEKEGD